MTVSDPRTPAEILAEWRATERALDAAEDEADVEDLQAHVMRLRDEHRAAISGRTPHEIDAAQASSDAEPAD